MCGKCSIAISLDKVGVPTIKRNPNVISSLLINYQKLFTNFDLSNHVLLFFSDSVCPWSPSGKLIACNYEFKHDTSWGLWTNIGLCVCGFFISRSIVKLKFWDNNPDYRPCHVLCLQQSITSFTDRIPDAGTFVWISCEHQHYHVLFCFLSRTIICHQKLIFFLRITEAIHNQYPFS